MVHLIQWAFFDNRLSPFLKVPLEGVQINSDFSRGNKLCLLVKGAELFQAHIGEIPEDFSDAFHLWHSIDHVQFS